jgi:trafficking protein particle complex subunit 10
MGLALSRLATARQRMAAQGRDGPDNSVHSIATTVTDSSDVDGPDPMDVSMNSAASASTSGMLFSKQDKELFRKFNSDFPNGTTCILSTLLEGLIEDPKLLTLRQQEWSSFMRALGNCIVEGFKDRCRRYDDELRRLQMLPGTTAANRSPVRKGNDETGSKKGGMDLSHFFLVKESLAFTYEQMQLPTEALLQYSELRAFLPDIGEATIEERKKSRKRRSSLEGNSALEIAIAGDIRSFRKRMRTIATDIKPIAHVVEQYIFAREVSLLFKMKQPVELVHRCHVFAETMYNFHLRAASHAKDEGEKKEQLDNAEEWALTFCWDIKCASEVYFTLMKPSSKASLYGDYAPVKDPDVQTILTERSLAREISSLLEFGRVRLLQLGDSKLDGPNPVRARFHGTPNDMKQPWAPWDPEGHKSSAGNNGGDDENIYSSRDEFLKDAFSSPSSFVSKYVEMASSIATFALFAGRQRIAARLQGELAEIRISRGEDKDAINTLISTVNILGKDQWDKCHFWRLLRLASCQRRVGPPANYLKTLVNCFGPNISNVAPSKALGILLSDLEAVVGDESIKGTLFRSVPFLAARLEVQETSSGESSMAFGPERKQLNKKFCTVGEKIRIILTTSSFLPKSISVDAVSLSLVAFGTYASKIESKAAVEKEDAFKVLSLESPTVIEPGVNTFTFEWVPINTGQYILASLELKWKEASFCYDSLEMRRSLVGVDVLPSDPSQSITLEPYFLVPGNIQPVRIIFYSGSDVITKGTVNLTCTPGVMLIPPNEEETDDNWTDSCTVKLPACGTGETIVLTTSVRTPDPYLMPPTDEVQALSAKVATLYRHADYVADSGEDESNMPCMKTVLEAMVPTLEKPVLTVERADVFPTTVDGFLIRVSLNCNSPVPYHVKSWLLELPKPIAIVEGADLNERLFDVPVVEGEVLSFGFTCRRETVIENRDGKMDEILEPALHIELEDEFGTVFNEVLAVDLTAFYNDVTRDSKLSGFGSVPVELKDFALEGVVGEPVSLTYSIETVGLQSLQKEIVSSEVDTLPSFLYAVKYDEADWLVSGHLKGRVLLSEDGSYSLSLVGIPTRPGSIKRFPKISLQCEVSKGDLLPLLVDMREPEKFSSRPFGGQMAVACPQRK